MQFLANELVLFLKKHRGLVLEEEEIHKLLANAGDDFCTVFYLLSECNSIVTYSFFDNYIKNRQELQNNESDKQLYYLYEGIRNQIRLNVEKTAEDQVYLILHYFLIHKNATSFQNLLIYLFYEYDNNEEFKHYRFHEFIITHDLLQMYFGNNNKNGLYKKVNVNSKDTIDELDCGIDTEDRKCDREFTYTTDPTVFQLKLLKFILEIDNESIREYVINKKMKIKFSKLTGCKRYFKEWYSKLENKRITIEFE